MTEVTLYTDDSVTLEARWDLPETPTAVAVFCHPHPQQRGTMNAPLMTAVTRGLVAAHIAVLRFNFRGVGASTGSFGGGIDEQRDITAAAEHAWTSYPDLPRGMAGWSFGAATSLQWMADHHEPIPWVGIAPPVSSARTLQLPEASALAATPRLFILGDRDQFTTVEDLRGYVDAVGGQIEVLSGSDHFFYFREDKVAELVANGLTG